MVNMMMVSGMVSAYGLLLVRIQEEFGSSSLMTAAILGTLLLARGVGGKQHPDGRYHPGLPAPG